MKYYMAANWKMFKTQSEAIAMLAEFKKLLPALPAERDVAIFAPFTSLAVCSKELEGTGILLGGQNFYPAKEGAFTGEISADMLTDTGCATVLVGHSERRALFGESDEFIGKKVAYALEHKLDVVLCVGETLAQREANELAAVLDRQLAGAFAHVAQDINPQRICVAYEPVWAIGTGKVAGTKEILEAHRLVRDWLVKKYGSTAKDIRILYGGSVKPENATEIISLDNVNGVLVGGASLHADSFSQIVVA